MNSRTARENLFAASVVSVLVFFAVVYAVITLVASHKKKMAQREHLRRKRK